MNCTIEKCDHRVMLRRESAAGARNIWFLLVVFVRLIFADIAISTGDP